MPWHGRGLGQRHGRRCKLSLSTLGHSPLSRRKRNLERRPSSVGFGTCASAKIQRERHCLIEAVKSFFAKSVSQSIPLANCHLLIAMLHSRRACSNAHSTDRNRTGGESNFPFTRLYSVTYAWPQLCAGTQFLKQNASPHVVEA